MKLLVFLKKNHSRNELLRAKSIGGLPMLLPYHVDLSGSYLYSVMISTHVVSGGEGIFDCLQ